MNLVFHRRFAARRARATGGLLYVLAALLAPGGTARAGIPGDGLLRPEHVLVVANANARGSVALAKYYCLARNILQDRLIALRTTDRPDVARAAYNTQIRDPIRAYLARHDRAGRIRCIVLVWGVPVRVLGSELAPEQTGRIAAYKTRARRLAAGMSVNISLLREVGAAFPRPRTPGLRPLGDLFRRGEVGKPTESGTFDSLAKTFAKALAAKAAFVARMTDDGKRKIALRQLAALRLNTYGAKGLLGELPDEKVPGVPAKQALGRHIASDEFELARLEAAAPSPENDALAVDHVVRLRGLTGAHKYCRERIEAIDTAEEDASVDSELALVRERQYKLRKWLPNPMNWRVRAVRTKPADLPGKVLMTARIDGPEPKDALRIVKDSIAAEKAPLKGTFYIDAGGKYPHYDKRLERLYELVRRRAKVPVKYDRHKSLFAAGECPDAALYVGWYSLQAHVPAFTWVRGSVGWHVASLEAQHLREPKSNEWCVKLLQDGIAATLGAVNEPFLGAFPPPEEFFALLLTGRFSVGECYWRTNPLVSWRMTLIADPLYNPFQRFPKLSVFDLPPQLGEWKRAEGPELPPPPPMIPMEPKGEPSPE